MNAEDDRLLAELGVVARQRDPVPSHVAESGRALFGLLRVDAELAELVHDSDLLMAGVRSSSSDVRLLTFEAGQLVVEAQVSRAGGRRALLGQIVVASAPTAGVRLDRADHPLVGDSATDAAPLDDAGHFRFDDVPAGTVRLAVELPGGRTVTTAWFTV